MGEILSIFLYLIEKKLSNENFQVKKIKTEKIFQKKKILNKKYEQLYILLIIFFCGIIDALISFDYSYYYSNEMNKINNELNKLNRILLIFFIFIFEIYFYNIQTYKHHFLGLIFCVFSLLLIIIPNIIKINNIHIHFFLLFIYILKMDI